MAAPDNYGQGVSVWQMTDAPSIPGAAQALADGIIPRTVMRFASASARGAALTGAYAPVEGMATYLADVNRLEVYDGASWAPPPQALTSTTSGLVVSSGFSQLDFSAYREGRTTMVDVYLTRTGGTISESGGNIADTACCTLPAGWRPTHQTINGAWDNGVVSGGFVVGTDGVCTLRSAGGDITSGTNMRLHIVFIKTT
jgi:hypothetical protein